MRKAYYCLAGIVLLVILMTSFSTREEAIEVYTNKYKGRMSSLLDQHHQLKNLVSNSSLTSAEDIDKIRNQIALARLELKKADFWLRYLEPTAYKKINGPLPVEWETEVFEKFEQPYKREGGGLTLAEIYLDDAGTSKDSLLSLIEDGINAMTVFEADSITQNIQSFHHFYLCNRLFLLNLASIYTTGFECPDSTRVVPELRAMLHAVEDDYKVFNQAFPKTAVSQAFLSRFNSMIDFVDHQSNDITTFDHFRFIRDFVNPLFKMNQQAILQNKVRTKSFVDYSLNKSASSIFDKQLYFGQNEKGIFLRVTDERVLATIDSLGKLLFYDPILSVNNERSCASCHRSDQFFTDTSISSALQLNRRDRLDRNTPTLVNSIYNHLIMQDGKHISLQDQVVGVITDPNEMGATTKEVLNKVMTCSDYKKAFQKLLSYTPWESEVTIEHLASAITLYYSKFSKYNSPFDRAMNDHIELAPDAIAGFNIFMGKAACATCHFVPQFNGVKPPYVGSEFEVLGVPGDSAYKTLSKDKGRFLVNPAKETEHAFRTGTIRNVMHTAPYMHNGVFRTMDEVINFYDMGGGAGRGLEVENQTLSADTLHLSAYDKQCLTSFMHALSEDIPFEKPPLTLPRSTNTNLNKRIPGGKY